MLLTNSVDGKAFICSFSAEVQRIFNIPLFAQFFTAVCTICMTLFKMTLVRSRNYNQTFEIFKAFITNNYVAIIKKQL